MAKSFVERPKIPSMSEIAKDIEEAGNDDVIFQNFDPSSVLNGNVDVDQNETDNKDKNSANLEKLSQDISDAYQKAIQMVKLCEILREAPSKLELEYKELETQGKEVTSAIEDLKRSSQSLPSSTVPLKSQGKKKKGKK